MDSAQAGDRVLVQELRQSLGAGEAEAIALACEVGAAFLLTDERAGREVAQRLGVRVVGLAGVLLEAKRKHVIPAVKPHLDTLRNVAGFRLGDEVSTQILREAGEA